jgi:hypothetical protein
MIEWVPRSKKEITPAFRNYWPFVRPTVHQPGTAGNREHPFRDLPLAEETVNP